MRDRVKLSVFTKPWPAMPIEALGAFVRGLGFDGIELPVRPGFQVVPERVSTDLVPAARQLADQGVEICSVAGPTDEATIVACAEAGVPIIRVMARLDSGETYTAFEDRMRREYDAVVPLLERHGVTVGVQNHCGRFATNALALSRLLSGYDPSQIAIVWDAAHEALEGMAPDMALDVAWPQLCMVNLKNACYQLQGAEGEHASWRIVWTAGPRGLASWPKVVSELVKREYKGTLCLTAEYSDHEAVDALIAADADYARSLMREEWLT